MATIKRFEDLEIWQVARELAASIKNLTDTGLFSKDFRFKDQIKAASGSVMDNIAEGFERSSQFEFVNMLSIAKGSTGEVRSQRYRAIDYKYIDEDKALSLIVAYESLAGKIAGFMAYLNNSNFRGQKFKDRH